MPLDPQRLARVRAHFLAAAALVTGCGGSSAPDHTINERAPVDHVPPTPTAAPTESSSSATPPEAPQADPSADPSKAAMHVNTPPTATPTAPPASSSATVDRPPPGQPQLPPRSPVHVNTPARTKP
ncbi:hypothetical protein WME95_29735 [Sorangium sp. So ce327]|uniref:hypothetical protein n=1 Tax=Sorangium sp. So ce327 TaxID=3133301 RepID=UPI003F640791